MTRHLFPHLDADVLRASWRHWLTMSTPMAGPRWLQAVWTVLFSATLALVFTLLAFATTARTLKQWASVHAWAHTFAFNLTDTVAIGFVTRALFALVHRAIGVERVRSWPSGLRTVFFSGVSLLGVAIGWPLGATVFGAAHFGDPGIVRRLTAADLPPMVAMTALCTLVLNTWFAMRNRELRAEMRAEEAQLRLLQGQMEPHFLFNTLANVISLIDADAPRARQVLEAFTDYLRASLGGLRRTDSTLGAELELAERFLALMQVRMGERLRFVIEADASLRGAALPPLLLQPLVENAVKHGLEPQVDGGTVRVRAARVVVDGREALQVCVDDDGAGLAADASRPRPRHAIAGSRDGHGIALANLRERLQAQFGARGRLTLATLDADRGTRACLVVPWQAAASVTVGRD